jgi:hypothetical protein
MSVRCKMQLLQITSVAWSPTAKILKFHAQYDTSTPEDQRFAKATPNGEITMQVDNPAALDQMELGAHYYVDFTAAPES